MSVPRLTYGVPEVAESLGVSVHVVYRQLEAGEMPGFKLGKRWLVPVEALGAFVRDQTGRDGAALADRVRAGRAPEGGESDPDDRCTESPVVAFPASRGTRRRRVKH